ncbi:hypothetical protein HQ447_16355 [bacterium]|nr:hypothetical protein [bacterium]
MKRPKTAAMGAVVVVAIRQLRDLRQPLPEVRAFWAEVRRAAETDLQAHLRRLAHNRVRRLQRRQRRSTSGR